MSHASAIPTADQVRAIRIGALELLLQIEQSDVEVEPAFLETLRKLAQNPVREDLRPLMEAAR
ncbi:conserved hypothetical protein [Burkholderia diffusa]|uniref:hypothetical protein n=1 Tax=Burkholderia diffusa TaxID=488732 RepID=UPI001CB49474|nr:hypothetical protein [Burkholderia diffusa]CAG9259586.1 conserved hypothetical protein [Burkholderia diffusa]